MYIVLFQTPISILMLFASKDKELYHLPRQSQSEDTFFWQNWRRYEKHSPQGACLHVYLLIHIQIWINMFSNTSWILHVHTSRRCQHHTNLISYFKITLQEITEYANRPHSPILKKNKTYLHQKPPAALQAGNFQTTRTLGITLPWWLHAYVAICAFCETGARFFSQEYLPYKNQMF